MGINEGDIRGGEWVLYEKSRLACGYNFMSMVEMEFGLVICCSDEC